MKELKQLLNLINKDRYKNISNWKFDRIIFNIAMLLIFGYLFFVAWHYNFDMDFFKCETINIEDSCINPFYKPITWKNVENLPTGEYGTKLGLLFESVFYVVIGLLILAFCLNHLLYNRGVKFEKNNNNGFN